MSDAWFIVLMYVTVGLLLAVWAVDSMDPPLDSRWEKRWCVLSVTVLWLPIVLVLACMFAERGLRRLFGGSHGR